MSEKIKPDSAKFNPLVDSNPSVNVAEERPVEFDVFAPNDGETRKKLDSLIEQGNFYMINGKSVRITKWELNGNSIVAKGKTKYGQDKTVRFEMEYFDEVFNEQTLQKQDSVEAKITEPSDKIATIPSLRSQLLDDLKKIRSGEMNLDQAKAISSHVQAIVGLSKLELEFIKTIKTNDASNDTKKFLGK